MATSPVFIKGQACIIEGICFYTNDGTLVTDWTGADATLSQDGAEAVAATNNPVEIAAVGGGSGWGVGSLTLTSGEANCDRATVLPTITNSGAIIQPYVIYFSDGAGDIPVNSVAISNSTVAADNVEANIGNLDAAVSAVPTAEENRTEMDNNSSKLTAIYDDLSVVGGDASSAAASGTAITARFGAISATAGNQLDDWLLAMAADGAAAPATMTSAGFDPATDSLEAIRNNQGSGGASVEDIVDGIEASPIIDSIYDKTLQIGTANATIVTPVAPSGTLVIHQGVSMTLWESMAYDCRLISGFDEATHPVKLFVDYRNGSRLVATIDVADITETASAINVDLAPTFTSAVTRDMPIGSFPAQIVAFTNSSAERHIILELTVEVRKPGFDYSAVDTI